MRSERISATAVQNSRPEVFAMSNGGSTKPDVHSGQLSWLRVPDDAQIPADVKALWAARPFEKLGFVPNVLKIFALRPTHLLAWWAHYDELMRGPSRLSKAQREMIAVVVSTANRCHY